MPTDNWLWTVKCMSFIVVNTDRKQLHCFFIDVRQLNMNRINSQNINSN